MTDNERLEGLRFVTKYDDDEVVPITLWNNPITWLKMACEFIKMAIHTDKNPFAVIVFPNGTVHIRGEKLRECAIRAFDKKGVPNGEKCADEQ